MVPVAVAAPAWSVGSWAAPAFDARSVRLTVAVGVPGSSPAVLASVEVAVCCWAVAVGSLSAAGVGVAVGSGVDVAWVVSPGVAVGSLAACSFGGGPSFCSASSRLSQSQTYVYRLVA